MTRIIGSKRNRIILFSQMRKSGSVILFSQSSYGEPGAFESQSTDHFKALKLFISSGFCNLYTGVFQT